MVRSHRHGEGATIGLHVHLLRGDREERRGACLLHRAGQAHARVVADYDHAAALGNLFVSRYLESVDIVLERLLGHPVRGRTQVVGMVCSHSHREGAAIGLHIHLLRRDREERRGARLLHRAGQAHALVIAEYDDAAALRNLLILRSLEGIDTVLHRLPGHPVGHRTQVHGVIGSHGHIEGTAGCSKVDLLGRDGEHLLRPGLPDRAGQAGADLVTDYDYSAAFGYLLIRRHLEGVHLIGDGRLRDPFWLGLDLVLAGGDDRHLDVAAFGRDVERGRRHVHHVHQGRGGLAAGLGRDGRRAALQGLDVAVVIHRGDAGVGTFPGHVLVRGIGGQDGGSQLSRTAYGQVKTVLVKGNRRN